MKKIKITLALLITVLILSGCSVTALNNTISDAIIDDTSVISNYTIGTIIEDDYEREEEKETVSESKTSSEEESKPDNEKGIGESFDSDVKYETAEGTQTRGTTGLKYTLNSVEIFDNFYDSGEDILASNQLRVWDYDNYCWGELDDNGKVFIANNNFILVEMTASYVAPEGGKEEIIPRISQDVYPTYKEKEMPEGWIDEILDLKHQGKTVMEPFLAWFSEPILEEDGFDIIHDAFCFKLKDGESRTFKIGIFCWEKFIEYKNVYLSIQHFNPGVLEGYDGRYFALFPQE